MEQTGTVLLDYHKPESQGANAYWTGKIDGHEMKFIRVIAGLSVPQLDRQAAAVIVLGELQRSFAPPDFTGLSAAVGTWAEVKNALAQFCRDLKTSDIICENEQTRRMTWPVTDSLVGSGVSVLSAVAPPLALTEVGRQAVEQLIKEDRIHIEHLLDVMDLEKDQSSRALQCAVGFALEFAAFYAPGKKRGQPESKPLGTKGL